MAKKSSSPKKTTKTISMSNPGTASGRPLRSNRGIGGQRAQLEKASAVVGEGLLQKVTGQKRDRNNLITIPEDLSENDMAPPIATKRARISKPVIIIHLSVFFVYRTSITNCLCNQNRFLSQHPEFLTEQNDLSKLHPSLL